LHIVGMNHKSYPMLACRKTRTTKTCKAQSCGNTLHNALFSCYAQLAYPPLPLVVVCHLPYTPLRHLAVLTIATPPLARYRLHYLSHALEIFVRY
jgi:hypothetical protein